MSGQASVLERVKGVGKKTAQRLVLELKDVIGSEPAPGPVRPKGDSHYDAVQALVTIGYSPAEAEERVRRALGAQPNLGLEETIRVATRSQD